MRQKGRSVGHETGMRWFGTEEEAAWSDPLSHKGIALYVVLTALTVSRGVTVKVLKLLGQLDLCVKKWHLTAE